MSNLKFFIFCNLFLIWGNEVFPQIKKYMVVSDTVINNIALDNLGCFDVLLNSEGKLFIDGAGHDNTLDSNNTYFFTTTKSLELDTQFSFKTRKKVNDVLTAPAFNQSLVEKNNRIYQAGYYGWGVDYQYKTEAYLLKMNLGGSPIDSVTWGWGANKFLKLTSIDTSSDYLYISGHQRSMLNYYSPQKFYLAKADTNLNILWEKTYPEAAQPESIYNTTINRNRIYMCGYRYAPPWFDDPLEDHILRKTDTAGNLLATAYLPFKKNQSYATLNVLDDGIHEPKLVTVNFESPDNTNLIGETAFYEKRIRILDTNLQILKTIIIPGEAPGGYLEDVKNLGNGKLLLFGERYLDFNNQDLAAWSSLIDTSGHVYWDHTYKTREDAFVFLSDGLQLPSGGFLFCGLVSANAIYNQDAIIIMVDSMGCLDTTGCYPMGINSLAKQTSQFKIFPNPNSGEFSIQSLDKAFAENTKLLVYDLTGKAIQTKELPIGKKEANINLLGLVDGLYVLKILQGREVLYQGKIKVFK